MKEYLSLEEAVTYTGYGKQTLRRLIKDGKLKASQVNRDIRIRISDIDKLMDDSVIQPESEVS